MAEFTDEMRDPKVMADLFDKFINGASRKCIQEFASVSMNTHPTLQQLKMGAFLRAFKVMSEKPYVDLRNQESFNIAQKIIKGYPDECEFGLSHI